MTQIVERIRSKVGMTRFSNKFLSMVGDMCGIYGYGVTRLLLARRNECEAKALLRVLRIIEEENLPVETGTIILKNLNAFLDLGSCSTDPIILPT